MAGVEASQNLQRSDTPITDDTTIIPFRQPGSIIDPLTEIAPLRANKSETSDSLKFTLEGAGERFDGNARTSAHALAFLA